MGEGAEARLYALMSFVEKYAFSRDRGKGLTFKLFIL
jgi:hypothetical protein